MDTHLGGRGIVICDRWLHSFESFFTDMGPRPSPKHSIDRIDNDGNYEPSNCRWATAKQQERNKPGTLTLTYRGETLPLAEWAERLGVTYMSLWRRHSLGQAAEQILTVPVRPFKHRRKSQSGAALLAVGEGGQGT